MTPMPPFFLKCCLGLLVVVMSAGATPPEVKRFVFSDEAVSQAGATRVWASETYTKERGYGFEPGSSVVDQPRGVLGSSGFHFTTDLPEGNWRVWVTLRGEMTKGHNIVAVKGELRRLMLGPVKLVSNETLMRGFIINTRSRRIAAQNGVAEGVVRLKAPRETTQEAWAWDDRLTLEIHGAVLVALEITRVHVPTVFLLGDSTVCDQSREPYNSWGQMLTHFFKETVAIANHGESGETYRDAIGRRRLDKVISVMQPGDYLFMQFGHNDQKQVAAGTGGPFTTYVDEMKTHIAAVRRIGGIPVVVSPMERRNFDAAGKVVPSLADYARAARETAAAERVAFIDLNAMSIQLYEALGPEKSAEAFAAPEGKVDSTHHNNYGSYELARCITRGIVEAKLPLAAELVYEFPRFDPARPDDLRSFAVPASPNFTNQRPLGD
jgi:lysophospholipase L1-like esterase